MEKTSGGASGGGESGGAGGGLVKRVVSMDAYRGFVMFLMMAEVMEFARVAAKLPGNAFWAFLGRHQSHVEWTGCSLHDLIQPSFSFLVGVALPFSLLRRKAEGQPEWQRTLHAFWRALLLVFLGVFLRSVGSEHPNWTFEDTLSQIGLGYGFLYILAHRSVRVQWGALAVLLVGYWLAFALYPLPGDGFDWARAGAHEYFTGFAAHWNLNTNAAWAFDTWFLNLKIFGREQPFTHNGGGYATLSFIPTLGTMVLGLIAGGVLSSGRKPWEKIRWLAIACAVSLGIGWFLGYLGVCPVVKKIWTPSWTLFSGGLCFLFLAAFYLVIDIWNFRMWSFPLVVIGMNSIAAYMIAHLFVGFIGEALPRHLGDFWFTFAGKAYEPFLHGAGVLFCEWLILFWMYRRNLFLRV